MSQIQYSLLFKDSNPEMNVTLFFVSITAGLTVDFQC